GGFPEQPLMEDIELSARLRRIGAPACLPQRVTTSARRWQRGGTWSTVLMMWRLRLLYRLGVAPERLARQYR
ncbi:MAG TPA: glycosyl transferase, partial [Albitalea sp.]|nr:glycosyl transferase [Albitalea sp.]